MVSLQTECEILREQNHRLKESCGGWLNDVFLRNDNSRVKFYAGIPYFNALFTHFCPHKRTTLYLNQIQHILMLLVKLRLNLANQDFAYCCGGHQSSVYISDVQHNYANQALVL